MSRRKYAFLIHLWFDGDEDPVTGGARWRGSVEFLATRRRRYFNDLTELVAILASSTQPEP